MSSRRVNGPREVQKRLFDRPIVFFLPSVFVLWLSAQLGVFLRRRRALKDTERADLGPVQAATLTLLALIIGFSFSMAINRYDLRKNYEEAEANAIGTAYVRAGLLPAAQAAELRAQLRKYLDLRVSFYQTRSDHELQQINADTVQLQAAMWSAVQAAAVAQPSPVIALVVSSTNDVLNSQGYTQAAWWNRIPTAAWILMVLIAVSCNVLAGYSAHIGQAKGMLLWVLPLVISIAFMLIADIDSPRRGLIHVHPQNLLSLSESLPR